MKSKAQKTCVDCQYLGEARLESEAWRVCKYPSIMDTFEGGRYIDSDTVPEWCLKPSPKSKFTTHRSLEDSFVRVIHEPTGICEESNLHKSTHKNVEDAMRKITTRLENMGDKDGSEREAEILKADGPLGGEIGY